MADEKWGAPTDRSTVLTTEAEAIADGNYSAVGTLLDNATNKDRFALAELTATFAGNPTAESTVELYAVVSRDAATYPDGDASKNPSALYWLAEFQLRAVTTAQRVVTPRFELPGPFKMKFLIRNRSGQTTPTGIQVLLSTFNRSIN